MSPGRCRDLAGFKLCLIASTVGVDAAGGSARRETLAVVAAWLACWNSFCRDEDDDA